MRASVVIATKNRCEEVAGAIDSALSQSGDTEVIVVDDASTDRTSEVVQDRFPAVRYIQLEESHGYIAARNAGARLARGEIVFSIDDDATFSSGAIIANTLPLFLESRVGAVAVPYCEPPDLHDVMQRAPDLKGLWVTDAYVGTAHAVRRDAFMDLGGYREGLVHQGEESDFCIRLLDRGLVVALGTGGTILHCPSIKRSYQRMDYYGARNSVLFAWQNVPSGSLPVHLLATTVRSALWTLEPTRLATRLMALLDAYKLCRNVERSPVSWQTYRLFRRLRKRGPIRLSEVQSFLRPRTITVRSEGGQPD